MAGGTAAGGVRRAASGLGVGEGTEQGAQRCHRRSSRSRAFSDHRFEEAVPSLRDDVRRTPGGGELLIGRDAVLARCREAAARAGVATTFERVRVIVGDLVGLGWEMVAVAAGTVAGSGYDAMVLDDDGRILLDHQHIARS